MQSLGHSKQYGKKDSEVRQFLKKIFVLSLLPPAEVCTYFALEFLSNLPNDKRVEQFCDYLLEIYIYADCRFPLPVWSECFVSSLRTIKALSYSMSTSMHYFTVCIIKIFSFICTEINID